MFNRLHVDCTDIIMSCFVKKRKVFSKYKSCYAIAEAIQNTSQEKLYQ